MEKASNNRINGMKGVLTLDSFNKTLKVVPSLLTLLLIFSTTVFGARGHSTLDIVDPSFNPQITTDLFQGKDVNNIVPLADGKIIVGGVFNSYNRQPVNKIVRLNSDGSLDKTFNTNLIAQNTVIRKIILQNDGKIIVIGIIITNDESMPVKRIVRLQQDGTLDSTFDYVGNYFIYDVTIDDNGKILLAGNYPDSTHPVIRLNTDGSLDGSFSFNRNALNGTNRKVATFANKVFCIFEDKIIKLNEDGTPDTTFTQRIFGNQIESIVALASGKILVLNNTFPNGYVLRLNSDGSDDDSFTIIETAGYGKDIVVAEDEKIFFSYDETNGTNIQKFNENGTTDNTFNIYSAVKYGSFGVQVDGTIIVGDQSESEQVNSGSNNFVKLLTNGNLDNNFNINGIGFQNMFPGIVNSIAIQPDGKIVFGGGFDSVNNITRFKLARLNRDSTLDNTFEINTSGLDNTFSRISDIYHVAIRPDGKMLASGNFDYKLNGETKSNFVRLNSDGNIDPTFNLSVLIQGSSGCCKPIPAEDNKVFFGKGRLVNSGDSVPIKLNSDGTIDTTFNSDLLPTSNSISIYDLLVQPDGKLLVAGKHSTLNVEKSFIARLNPNGSVDQSFENPQEIGFFHKEMSLLPDGKILVITNSSANSFLQRLNPDGSPDTSFEITNGTTGKLKAILRLANGNIFIGGAFSSINGKERRNLAQLNEDGVLIPITYHTNGEVKSLVADSYNRVLVGGVFTTILVNDREPSSRSYIARLIDSSSFVRYDFDGDGIADPATFNNENGIWEFFNSQNNQTYSKEFGLNTDKAVTEDFDGDGTYDIAVYRPSEGTWYLNQSNDGFSVISWGIAEDIPVPADFDGDGKSDIAVWRPSTGIWYILNSSNNQPTIIKFGLGEDIPLQSADFDGDGKSDIAVWRPSNGNFYWLESDSNNQFRIVHFGTNGDIPSVGDFNGDGKTDLVVFRPSNGIWYQYLTSKTADYRFSAIKFGLNGDEPVAADYDGDGETDIAIRRNGVWHTLMSDSGYSAVTFGDPNTKAVAALTN